MDAYVRMKRITYSKDMVGVQTRSLGALHEREGANVERHTERRSLPLEAAAAAAQHSSVCEHRNVDCPPAPPCSLVSCTYIDVCMAIRHDKAI